MHWPATYLQLISIGVSICTLLVWIFYARLLRMTFRRNERPMILIYQAKAEKEGSFCLVANLSRQPMHVVAVDLIVRTDEHEIKLRINGYERITNFEETKWATESVMKEGPPRTAEHSVLGRSRACSMRPAPMTIETTCNARVSIRTSPIRPKSWKFASAPCSAPSTTRSAPFAGLP